MTDRFSAFTFVDRITELSASGRVCGSFRVPERLDCFPASLMAEAVGQLAAWAAMDRVGYRVRPVAGIAEEARYLGQVKPGQVLELGADLESCSEDDVVYNGWARVGGVTTVKLTHCLGPMLPMTEFDDPADVHRRFQVLRQGGDGSDPFRGIPEHAIETSAHDPGKHITASLHVPEQAAFFADHFPRRPVYPATLLLDALSGVALRLAQESGHWPSANPPRVLRIINMKMRAFISPGQELELLADLPAPASRVATAKLSARMDGRRIATAKADIGHSLEA